MNRTWAIVLAGGDGTRLEAESIKRYGYARPKQYCDFDGTGTLLEQTLERAKRVVPEDRIVVVTTRPHRAEADDVLSRWPAVLRIEQPRNADTTAGMLLPTLHVLGRDAQATLLFLPSDHHVRDQSAFAAALARSAAIASASGGIVILGAEPEGPEDGYGWVVPGAVDGAGAHSVERFREKPPLAEVATLVESGALVNTFVLAARVETMVELIARHVPETWDRLANAWWSDDRLVHAYEHLRPSSFSCDVLEHARSLRVVPVSAGWSDVGTPERLERDVLASQPARSGSLRPLRGEAHV
jgi:mannose-1-phosphate guanylyltransferase